MSRRRPVNVQVHLRRNETQEHMIKRFMKKVKNEKIIEEYRENEFFEKPSVINARKRKRRKNVYKKLRMQQEGMNKKEVK
jgi:small subunit ribosomal protein S21